MFSATLIRVIAAVGAVIVLGIIIMRRRGKGTE
jgi:hypothetical protein